MAHNQTSLLLILGAGASADCGLDVYRGTNGKYTSMHGEIEKILSGDNFAKNPDEIWNYYKQFYTEVQKSRIGETYKSLVTLLLNFPESIILTQNIDGHINYITDVIPTTKVFELHGNINYMRCLNCKKLVPANYDTRACDNCNSTNCRPNIVLFGERLFVNVHDISYAFSKHRPSKLIVIGTTLQFPYLINLIRSSKIPYSERYFFDTSGDTLLSIKSKWKSNKSKKSRYYLCNNGTHKEIIKLNDFLCTEDVH